MPLKLPPYLATVLLASAILSACGKNAQITATPTIRPVVTFTVGQATNAAPNGAYSAEIKPRVEARLAFRVGGKIAERMVELGANVQAGQALMRLDLADLQLAANASGAQVAAAKANDELAQSELKRTQSLAEQGFVSAGRVDQALSQAKASRANLEAVQASASVQTNATQYAVLRADAAGIVTALEGEVGQIVAAGTPMLRIAQGSAKDVVFSLPETLAAQAKNLRGQSVAVQLWAQPGASYTATVREVAALARDAAVTGCNVMLHALERRLL